MKLTNKTAQAAAGTGFVEVRKFLHAGQQSYPRTLDLDLIAFGGEIRTTKALTLPHPRAHTRRFVLHPLSEIAPELVLPGQTQSVAQLLERLPPDPNAPADADATEPH